MYVGPEIIAQMEARFGTPATYYWEQAIAPGEMAVVRWPRRHREGEAGAPVRAHDLTFFIFRGEELALIRKPSFPPGAWRPPSGGLEPGEDFERGARREAWEETGLEIALQRYLVRTRVRFYDQTGDEEMWTSHVCSARALDGELQVHDNHEIAGVRWGTVDELQGPIRQVLLATGRSLFAYRVRLHDAAAAALRG
ncbi:MAG: NUDIX hydrolase [Anaerolineae bacterium]|nr:NUDIX hydrolase [Anaerolineae bacterium]